MRQWVILPENQHDWKLVVSTIGAGNTTDAMGIESVTLRTIDTHVVGQDTVDKDMLAYQKFKITGVGIKATFNPPTVPEVTPITW